MQYKQVRGSEIQDFLRCRKRWHYRWVEKLKAKKPNGKLFFGTLFHKFVQSYYNNLSHTSSAHEIAYVGMEQLFAETDTSRMEQVELDDLWDLVTEVTSNYVKQWSQADEGIQVIATELNFLIPLDEEIAYEGTIDLIYLDQNGQLKFKDYKTTTSIDRYDKGIDMDRQISRYYWALQQLARGNGFIWDAVDEGWVDVSDTMHSYINTAELSEPTGFVLDVVLKDYPRPPEELKKGGLSKNKAQKTTFKLYADTLAQAGMGEWKDGEFIPNTLGYVYDDMLEHLLAQETEFGNRFFKRIPVIRNQDEIDAAIDEFYDQALEAKFIEEETLDGRHSLKYNPIHRNITLDCSWQCEFKDLCHASLDGSNVDMLVSLMYEKENDNEEQVQSGRRDYDDLS